MTGDRPFDGVARAVYTHKRVNNVLNSVCCQVLVFGFVYTVVCLVDDSLRAWLWLTVPLLLAAAAGEYLFLRSVHAWFNERDREDIAKFDALLRDLS